MPIDRPVRQIKPPPSKSEPDQLRPISAYDDAASIVLLGDPGAGKSHTFRECAARVGGRFVTARTFLVTPATRFDGTLFIDGLDEKRAGRSDRDTVDALVEKLFVVAPGKVRISCRAADWLGSSDLAALRPYFGLSGDPVVLMLGRLSTAEQRAVLVAEGLTPAEADTFLHEATERSLGDFLENPQNLLMLLRAVRTGQWPATRKELFGLSTQVMLTEFDPDRARAGSGIFTADELRPAAGAICAARLISDIEAISLTDHETSTSIPSYRTLGLASPDKVIAALGRRIFVAGPAPESVDYAHRTTAEYLGAGWLADAVRSGMPFGRLQALMGVDGHPAPELRGLHAWLAIHLPEYATRLIDTDPYGVLTYGDAASLSQPSCAHLLNALGKLSQTDPWFRSGNWQSPAIGALSRADMVDEFRAVMNSNTAGFGVRSIVVEAAALGEPRPELKDDFAHVLLRAPSAYAERLYALIALLRIGPEGNAAVRTAFVNLGTDRNAVRLRAEIIRRLYGEPFGPVEIKALLTDIAASTSGDTVTGILYMLGERMPLTDIAAVLDGLPPAAQASRASRRNEWEVARFIDRSLIRAWQGMAEIDPARALCWLKLRNSYSSGYGGGRSDELRAAIRDRRDRLIAITDHFVETIVPDENRWLHLARFREVTLLEVAPVELLDRLMAHMERVPAGSDNELFYFEAALWICYSTDAPEGSAAFEKLFARAENRADLRPLRDAAITCKLPTGYSRRPTQDDGEQKPEELRRKFEKEADAIRNGNHLGWLGWAAQVYFGLFADSDDSMSPRKRLVEALGEANTDIAIAGFVAALSRTDLPTLDSVVKSSVQHQHYDWWFVLTAGLMERWQTKPGLVGLSDDFLKAMIAFDLTNPVFEMVEGSSRVVVPEWKAAIMQGRPEIGRDAYTALAQAKLTNGDQIVDGLRELMVEETFKPFRAETALAFLRDFPNADRFLLDQLIDGVISTPAAHGEFLALADRVLSGAVPVGVPQRNLWLAAAYLLSPSHYQAELEAIAAQRPGIVFDLRDHTGYDTHGDRQPSSLPLPQLEFLARLTGTLYTQVGFPTGGLNGNTNAWDAAEYCRKLIDTISALPSEAATATLGRLEADPNLASYSDNLRHALSNQEKRRRDSQYDRPDWPSTIKSLENGAPATAADLHALLLDQLGDLRTRIGHENTDIYKSFWNLDRYARPKTSRPEEACRDTLVTLLRPPLAPKGVTVEPEGHMVADKRADISGAMPGRKILSELKRDYHADLWTAADRQLERFYAHDPEAKGFGIYAVFWFGDKRGSAIPKHPGGVAPPKSAAELERMLRDLVPAERRHRIAVLVIDVTGPDVPKKRKAKKVKKKHKHVRAKMARTRAHGASLRAKKAKKAPSKNKSKKKASAKLWRRRSKLR